MKKNKFLITENVFLDSSIFEEQNFIASTKIHSLFHYAQKGAIKIHVTSISKLELFNRIEKRIAESKAELKKLTRTFESKNVRIIKNLGFYSKIDLPIINPENHITELKNKIEGLFKRSFVNTIKINNLPIYDIVENYYQKKPPFHNSGKQNEFIDAIVLKSLEIWCNKNKTKMYVLSKDPDFLGYQSENLIIKEDISELLQSITFYYDQLYSLNKVTITEKILEKNRSGLEVLAIDLIKEKVSIRGQNVDISVYEIVSNKLHSHKIISFQDDRTEIECIFKCEVFFYVFDINDFTESTPKKTHFTFDIPLFVEIDNRQVLDLKWLAERSDYVYEEI